MPGLLTRLSEPQPRLELDYWHKGGWRTKRFGLDEMDKAVKTAKDLIDSNNAKYFHLWRFTDGKHPQEVLVS